MKRSNPILYLLPMRKHRYLLNLLFLSLSPDLALYGQQVERLCKGCWQLQYNHVAIYQTICQVILLTTRRYYSWALLLTF
jgi:hypothetical protein